jgi:hypothetical protein
MATTFTNLNSAVIDDMVVAALRDVLPMLSIFSHIVETDDKEKNNIVRVPITADGTVGDKTPGTFVSGSGSLTGVDVTLNQFRGIGWDATEATTPVKLLPQLWAEQAAGGIHKIAKDVIDQALALLTATNYGDATADKSVVAPADFGQYELAQLWEKGQTKIKNQDQALLINSSYQAAMLGLSGLGLVFATSGLNFIASGKVPALMGMNVVHYNGVPTNSENLGGAVLGKAAIAIAIARAGFFLTAGDGNIVDRRVISDPQSGLSAMLTTKADAGGTLSGEVAMLFGVAKAQNAVVRLLTA